MILLCLYLCLRNLFEAEDGVAHRDDQYAADLQLSEKFPGNLIGTGGNQYSVKCFTWQPQLLVSFSNPALFEVKLFKIVLPALDQIIDPLESKNET